MNTNFLIINYNQFHAEVRVKPNYDFCTSDVIGARDPAEGYIQYKNNVNVLINFNNFNIPIYDHGLDTIFTFLNKADNYICTDMYELNQHMSTIYELVITRDPLDSYIVKCKNGEIVSNKLIRDKRRFIDLYEYVFRILEELKYEVQNRTEESVVILSPENNIISTGHNYVLLLVSKFVNDYYTKVNNIKSANSNQL